MTETYRKPVAQTLIDLIRKYLIPEQWISVLAVRGWLPGSDWIPDRGGDSAGLPLDVAAFRALVEDGALTDETGYAVPAKVVAGTMYFNRLANSIAPSDVLVPPADRTRRLPADTTHIYWRFLVS